MDSVGDGGGWVSEECARVLGREGVKDWGVGVLGERW